MAIWDNPLVLNLLAQQGYSTMPQSPLGAFGKAALGAQQMKRRSTLDDLQRQLIESRISALKNSPQSSPFGAIDPSKFTRESIAKFEQTKNYGDLELRPDTGGGSAPIANFTERQRLVDQFGENSPEVKRFDSYVRAPQYASIPGAGFISPNPAGQPTTVIPEPTIVAGTNTRAAAQGEGSRGNIMQPSGGFTPLPGSKAEMEQQAEQSKNAIRAQQQSTQAQTVVEDVQRLNKQIQAGDVPFGRTAAFQSALSPWLQSDGYRNAEALVKSVQGNVGVDQLINIKKQGSGLGQVPQQQLELLSRLLGELNLNQSKEQFIRTWNRTAEVYQQVWDAADKELAQLGRPTPDVFPKLDEPKSKTIDFNDLPP